MQGCCVLSWPRMHTPKPTRSLPPRLRPARARPRSNVSEAYPPAPWPLSWRNVLNIAQPGAAVAARGGHAHGAAGVPATPAAGGTMPPLSANASMGMPSPATSQCLTHLHDYSGSGFPLPGGARASVERLIGGDSGRSTCGGGGSSVICSSPAAMQVSVKAAQILLLRQQQHAAVLAGTGDCQRRNAALHTLVGCTFTGPALLAAAPRAERGRLGRPCCTCATPPV